jgi:hypothetical protein
VQPIGADSIAVVTLKEPIGGEKDMASKLSFGCRRGRCWQRPSTGAMFTSLIGRKAYRLQTISAREEDGIVGSLRSHADETVRVNGGRVMG